MRRAPGGIRGRAPRRAARAARLALAAGLLGLALYGFLASGTEAGWLARLLPAAQLLPAFARLLAPAAAGAGLLGPAAFALPLAASAIFGRWYCSVLCPLGTLQELAALARGKRGAFRRGRPALAAAAAVLCLLLLLAGAKVWASWLDPWSLFGRLAAYGLQPPLRLALRDDAPGLGPETLAAGLAAALVLLVAVFRGRWFCGSLCPVGAALGALNRRAPFRLRLDESACVACGRCSSLCPASCVDGAGRRLDEARCVYCLACLPACPTGAIRYGRASARKAGAAAAGEGGAEGTRPALAPSAISRAGFLAAAGSALGLTAASLAAGRSRLLESALRPPEGDGAAPVLPPGAGSLERFVASCTACGLCVARCPAKILRPSLGELGLDGLLAPRLDYEVSYCQFDCTLCLDLCPSGALERLGKERKRLTKIGDATLVKKLCVVIANGTRCGACAEHCPTGAVRMVPGGAGLPEPIFDSAICIGCGACHHACPVLPEKAITVAGLRVHRLAEKPSEALFGARPGEPGSHDPAEEEEKADEFPF